ncbi:hypothetical protein M404DRAFT_127581, partial [Pisolithus tinctorius Marx 270]
PPPPGDAETPEVPEDRNEQLNLHPTDPANFLKLSLAIRILIKHTINDHDIAKADRLLREYNVELIKLYGSSAIKPNHHYSTHVGNCARNFGPLHDFWTFLFERLNKVLKSFKANNHANGELETTFFKEFHRACESSRVIYSLRANPVKSLGSEAARIMQKATHEEHGTVAGLAALCNDLDEVSADAGITYSLSPRCHENVFSSETYRLLARTLNARFPLSPVHCQHERPTTPRSIPLNPNGIFYDYVVINGKRFHASRAVGTHRSSLVHVMIPGQVPTHGYGEILEIFQLDQPLHDGKQRLWFAHMRWFKPYHGNQRTIWDDLYVVLFDLLTIVRTNIMKFCLRCPIMGARGIPNARITPPFARGIRLDW